MGKVRQLRSRVHLAAMRPKGEAAVAPAPPEVSLPQPNYEAGKKDWVSAGMNIFARTKIDLSALVKNLDVLSKGCASLERGKKTKNILPKKEKQKLRREKWLQKIEAIKLAEQKLRETQRRRATKVVGDLRPLMDALPELAELEKSGGSRQPRRRVTSKPRPTELHRMSAVQRLQLLEEERARFQTMLASPAYQASPLQAIGQQLALQMQLEDGSRSQL
ncbi:PREDICTED: protein FAM207A [Elephantulus edwardii]|uniref:protein FAM207A n=1 Tax=Elephantulus edwardii TaxID=28737 RepID=UPI0003F0E7C5|nr:PREDICTED: protein FAM207A [Elephantulus edwardii]